MSRTAALALLLAAAAGAAVAQGGAGDVYKGASVETGRQFVLMFLQNIVDMPQNRPVELHVANPGNDVAYVTVTLPLYTSDSCQSQYDVSVQAGRTARIVLCPDIRHSHFDGSVSNKAVVVTSDRNVSLIGYNSEMYSADAFSILPLQSLRQIYLTTAYSPTNIATQFGIVATEENTTVGIYVKPTPSSGGGETFFDYNGVVYKNGDSVRFALPPLHTFLAYSISDLSGVVVWADKPVAVFSGNARTYVDYTRGSRDHIVEQAVPASQFGKSFAFLPTPRAHANDVVRIVARLRNTSVDVYSGSSRSTISLTNAGDVYEGSYTEVTHFVANKPVSISIVVRSQETPGVAASDPNDPSIYFLSPTELYSVETRLTPSFIYSVDNGPFARSYLLISIFYGQKNDIRVDGSAVSGWSKPASSPLQIVSAVQPVDPSTTHVVTSADPYARFTVVLYSASDRESAATTLGLSYYKVCVETPQIPGDAVDNDCDGVVDEEDCGNSIDDDLDILVNEDCSRPGPPPVQLGNVYEVVFLSNDVFDTQPGDIDRLELYVASTGSDRFTVNITSPSYLDETTGFPVVNFIDLTVSPEVSVINVTIRSDLRLGDVDDFGISKLTHKGIRVSSTNNQFFLYGINKRSFSTDSFLAYPMTAAENGQPLKTYYTISSNINGNDYDRTIIGIVAHEKDTDVYVDIRDSVSLYMEDGTIFTGPIRLNLTGMQEHDSYQLQSLQDLTGTRLTTSKLISVFSGNSRCKIPSTAKSRDHLVEQIPLTDYLGTNYISISSPRGDNVGDLWKVVATQPDTTVTFSYHALDNSLPDVTGATAALVQAGDFYVIDPVVPVTIYIQADQPILVGQLIKSETRPSVITDPALIYLPPPEQWTHNYWVATPLSGKLINGEEQPYNNTFLFVTDQETSNYITVLGATGAMERDGSTFTWYGIPGRPDLLSARVPIVHGRHHVLSSNNGTFMLIMYGAQDRESYASVAGLLFQLTPPPPPCLQTPMSIADGVDNDCDGKVDEELYDGLDNDNDGSVDEDCYATPAFTKTYYVVYQENLVEYPKLYALELYLGANDPTSGIVCRVSNPQTAGPHYDALVAIPKWQVQRFEFSPVARMTGSGIILPNSFKIECSGKADVFALNKDTYSADGYVAFPADTLGKEYYVMSYAPEALFAQYAVVATQPGETTITITEPGRNAFVVSLSENEVYQGQGADLTGTHILADKTIAAYSGDVRTSVKLSKSRDHLVVQLTSVDKWGSSFNLVPTAGRSVPDIYQIISAGPASLDLCCRSYGEKLSVSLGEVKQLTVGEICHLQSSAPILVARISQSHDVYPKELAGDPSMILLVPEAQYCKSATISTPVSTGGYTTLEADYAHYLTVLVPSGKESGLLFNGEPLAISPAWAPVNCSSFSFATFNLPGRHTTLHFSHSDPLARITAVMDGNADRESYSATVAHTVPPN